MKNIFVDRVYKFALCEAQSHYFPATSCSINCELMMVNNASITPIYLKGCGGSDREKWCDAHNFPTVIIYLALAERKLRLRYASNVSVSRRSTSNLLNCRFSRELARNKMYARKNNAPAILHGTPRSARLRIILRNFELFTRRWLPGCWGCFD